MVGNGERFDMTRTVYFCWERRPGFPDWKSCLYYDDEPKTIPDDSTRKRDVDPLRVKVIDVTQDIANKATLSELQRKYPLPKVQEL